MKCYTSLAEDWDKWVGEENDESKGEFSGDEADAAEEGIGGEAGDGEEEGGEGKGEDEYNEGGEAMDHDTNQYFNVSRLFGWSDSRFNR